MKQRSSSPLGFLGFVPQGALNFALLETPNPIRLAYYSRPQTRSPAPQHRNHELRTEAPGSTHSDVTWRLLRGSHEWHCQWTFIRQGCYAGYQKGCIKGFCNVYYTCYHIGYCKLTTGHHQTGFRVQGVGPFVFRDLGFWSFDFGSNIFLKNLLTFLGRFIGYVILYLEKALSARPGTVNPNRKHSVEGLRLSNHNLPSYTPSQH